MNNRVSQLNNAIYKGGSIIYWMSREQRLNNNWTLIEAVEFAKSHSSKLFVVFCIMKQSQSATNLHLNFMLNGLKKLKSSLSKLNIPFILLEGQPEKEILNICKELSAGCLFTDFDPLRIQRNIRNQLAG